jgi:hypothetical protein
MCYATHGSLVVEPHTHPTLWMAGFIEFGPQNSAVQFHRESEAAHDIIGKGASKQSNCDILAPGDGDILAQGLIELIEYSYQQGASSFSEAYLERTSKLSVLALEQFWMGDRLGSFLRCA